MKRLMFFALMLMFCFSLISCISTSMLKQEMGHYYVYKFGIRENTAKQKWKYCFYENDTFRIQFIPYYNKIYLSITNKVGADITVNWDAAVWSQDGNKSPILLAGNHAHLTSSTPNTIIDSDSTYRNYFRPAMFVKYDPKDSLSDKDGWRIFDIYPIYDHKNEEESNHIMGHFGLDMFTLKLPMTINGTNFTKTYTFFPSEMERVEEPKQIPRPSWN